MKYLKKFNESYNGPTNESLALLKEIKKETMDSLAFLLDEGWNINIRHTSHNPADGFSINIQVNEYMEDDDDLYMKFYRWSDIKDMVLTYLEVMCDKYLITTPGHISPEKLINQFAVYHMNDVDDTINYILLDYDEEISGEDIESYGVDTNVYTINDLENKDFSVNDIYFNIKSKQ